ncbi:MAG: hypothetical protein V3W04_00660 [Gammaproteobacteria bacterium]
MSYTIVFKRYAPFTSFGGGFHGDGRVTPSLTGSARTWGFITFSLSSGIIGYSAMSSPTFHTAASSVRRTGRPTISVSSIKRTPSSLQFSAQTAGSNPMAPGAPDIDTFIDVLITNTQVNGCLRGDDFPSAEVYLQDGRSGATSLMCSKHQLLCHFGTPHGALQGPGTRLFGAHRGQLIGTFSRVINI